MKTENDRAKMDVGFQSLLVCWSLDASLCLVVCACFSTLLPLLLPLYPPDIPHPVTVAWHS